MPPAKRKNAAASTSPMSPPAHADEADHLLNKDGSRRKSRVLRRKTDHSIIERRRREKINEKLVALQNLVPACRKECQDLIERKFVPSTLREANETDAGNSTASKRSTKRKREEEKLDKARNEMSEKIRTSMVLEKLCIISHTLDFVVKLQEENKALRALCDCQAERRASITSDVELDEHYRSAHSYESVQNARLPDLGDTLSADADAKRPSVSSSLSDQDSPLQDSQKRPAKRRLHWGSDDVREASIRSDACRHHCGTAAPIEPPCVRARSSSTTMTEASQDAVDGRITAVSSSEQQTKAPCHSSLSCPSTSEPGICHSFCRTRHSCCREEESVSEEVSSDASDDLASPPLCPVRWPAISTGSQTGYLGRQRLPPIVHLGLPKQHEAQFATLRPDTLASLYRRDLPRATDVVASRPFRPLSLYTSHVPASAPGVSNAKQ